MNGLFNRCKLWQCASCTEKVECCKNAFINYRGAQ